ncbi:MAG: nuclear transport factor 2 family protein [Sediminibacterium sp.]
MTTDQIARRLVELCRTGDFETAQKELFANDAVSIEPYASPEFEKETRGLDAILEKGRKFKDMVEDTHGGDVTDPIVSGNAFAMVMRMDMTMKGKGRMNVSELCVYEVKDGKIISETFHV